MVENLISGAEPPEAFVCDVCGSTMLSMHCKLICRSCGYMRDCSDL